MRDMDLSAEDREKRQARNKAKRLRKARGDAKLPLIPASILLQPGTVTDQRAEARAARKAEQARRHWARMIRLGFVKKPKSDDTVSDPTYPILS